MWIDTHAHLFDMPDQSIPHLLHEAAGAQVSIIVTTGTDIETSRTVLRQCRMYDELYGAAGISPFDVLELKHDWIDQLRSILVHPKMIGVGEIGIDRTNPRYPSFEKQLPCFEQQLHLARELDLPAIVHSRGAESEAADICWNNGCTKAVFHCFTGDLAALKKILRYGYYVSFSGIITFKNAETRDLVSSVPLDHVLIETDTPYLAPVPFRGKKNRPAWVSYVGEQAASLYGIDTATFQEHLQQNFHRLFSV